MSVNQLLGSVGNEFSLKIEQVIVEERVRKDFGNLDEFANSIREVGLIQPLVISRDFKLIAGERRLRALKKIGLTELIHAKHFIFNDEQDELRRKAIECEENIRRKAFTWQEEILAKKRLFDLMQQIHGKATAGRPSTAASFGVTSSGFGVNKLASLLGESNAQTSKDLELANYISLVPELAKADTKEAARKQLQLGVAVAIAQRQALNNPQVAGAKLWTLYEGDFVNNVNNIPDESVDLVITDPPYGENTQGMGPNSKQLLATGFSDDILYTKRVLDDIAINSWRKLKNDRFFVIFFGFAVYPYLVTTLSNIGFVVDKTPLIWVKNNVINTSPYTRYSRSYEPILIARKGEPRLVRPSQRDVIDFTNVQARTIGETKFYHAQKPVALMEKLILDMSMPSSTILDWCAGSGSTGVAAVQQKRNVILFERDISACNIIKTRLGAL